MKLTTADYAHRFLLRCSDTFSAYCFLGSSLRLYGSDAFSQSLERVNARQRPRHGNVRDETRRFARSARTRETRRVDSLDDEHQTSLQKRTFFILSSWFFACKHVRRRRRSSAFVLPRRRDATPNRRGVVTLILITRATRPRESMRERTMCSVRVFFTRVCA